MNNVVRAGLPEAAKQIPRGSSYKYKYKYKNRLMTMRPFTAWLLLCLAAASNVEADSSTSTLQCNHTPCGHQRIRICHFNGKEFQTLCIRQNSVLRRPNNHHASEQDYCGPCTHRKAFETNQELKLAVKQYISHLHYDVDLASTYGWPMTAWNVSLIQDFSEIFSQHATLAPDEDLSGWDVRRATNMALMFWQCHDKWEGRGLETWNTSSVQNMERMFFGDSHFNADLRHWNTARVTNMMGVFWKTSQFNQPLNKWDTSRVMDTSRMFADAQAFDQDLSSWKTSQMQDTSFMFLQAASFSHDLSNWQLPNVIQAERMFHKVPAYQLGTPQQVVVWKSWRQQWEAQGRSLETINTQEIFTSTSSSSSSSLRMEVFLPTTGTTTTATYMRGKVSTVLHINETALVSVVEVTGSSEQEGTISTVAEPASNDDTAPKQLRAKCTTGLCPNH
jgi:surface protein